MTRIIAGRAGSLRLEVPKAGTRPTSDRVREAVFSTLESWDLVHGIRVLDLYAGSGALGLEAASRGAASVTLVEKHPQAAQVAGRNARTVAAAFARGTKQDRGAQAGAVPGSVQLGTPTSTHFGTPPGTQTGTQPDTQTGTQPDPQVGAGAQSSRSGCTVPGDTESGSMVPGGMVPGGMVSGRTEPGSTVPGRTEPGGLVPEISVARQSVQAYLEGADPAARFDVVFIDPPYDLGEVELTANLTALAPLLAEGAVVMIERSGRSPEPTLPEALATIKQKRYGETVLWWCEPV